MPTDILLGRNDAKAATLKILIPAIPVLDSPCPKAARPRAAQISGERCIGAMLFTHEDADKISDLVDIKFTVAIIVKGFDHAACNDSRLVVASSLRLAVTSIP